MVNWTAADLVKWGEGKRGVMTFSQPKARMPRQWNKTEQAFGQYLDLSRTPHGSVKQWFYEAVTFKLGPDCRYTPDFMVIDDHYAGRVIFYEVKGRNRKSGKAYAKDDAMAKLRAAAGMFPFAFMLVWPDGRGGWESKAI